MFVQTAFHTMTVAKSQQIAFSNGVLFDHYSEADLSAWPNFSFAGDPKLYCALTKRFFLHPESMDALQTARDMLGNPILINSGHRSPVYNAMVRGAMFSCHKYIAFDIDFHRSGHDPGFLYNVLKKAGFLGLGKYRTFIHADMWRARTWYGSRVAKDFWTGNGW